MTPQTSLVESVVATTKPRPTTHRRTGSSAVVAAQLAAVLAAVAARDELAALAWCPSWPGLRHTTSHARTEYQQRLGDVVTAFNRVIRAKVARCRGVDYCGSPIDRDDLVAAAQLGVITAVQRFDRSRSNNGCVYYVTSWICWHLQLATGSTREKREEVDGSDYFEAGERRVVVEDDCWDEADPVLKANAPWRRVASQ